MHIPKLFMRNRQHAEFSSTRVMNYHLISSIRSKLLETHTHTSGHMTPTCARLARLRLIVGRARARCVIVHFQCTCRPKNNVCTSYRAAHSAHNTRYARNETKSNMTAIRPAFTRMLVLRRRRLRQTDVQVSSVDEARQSVFTDVSVDTR